MFGILNIYTDDNACDCTKGLFKHQSLQQMQGNFTERRKKEKKNPVCLVVL